MKVAMVTEGTYPINNGGVSQWCDQLVRGMPDVEFEVIALSGSGQEPLGFRVPENVVALRRVGLWAPVRRTARTPRTVRARFTRAYEQFLVAILTDDADGAAMFADALATLVGVARGGHLSVLLRGQTAVDLLVELWALRAADGGTQAALSLADAMRVTDLIEHYLRPLRLPPIEADLVHATANGPATMLGIAGRWASGTPVVLSEHGVYLRERIIATREASGSANLRFLLIRFFVRLAEFGYRQLDRVLPVSHFNARWARRGGAPVQHVETVHNGVNPDSFPPVTDEPEVPTLSFVGRIDPLKDLETLIRALDLVRQEVPQVRLRLFGPVPAGNEAYADRCAKLAADLGLTDRVCFEGPISPVARAYAAGHVVVLSSRSEGLPLTIIEAGMSGRACVATDVGGVAEAVGDGGIVVPAADPPAFAQACVQLLTDPALRRRLAAAGLDHAHAAFGLGRMVERFRAIYEALGPGCEPGRDDLPVPRGAA